MFMAGKTMVVVVPVLICCGCTVVMRMGLLVSSLTPLLATEIGVCVTGLTTRMCVEAGTVGALLDGLVKAGVAVM